MSDNEPMNPEDVTPEYMNRRENRPAIRFTGIIPASFGNDHLPNPKLLRDLLRSLEMVLSALGVTQTNVQIGLLGGIVKAGPETDALLMDEEKFAEQCDKQKTAKAAAAGESRAKESKISVDEMLKGIDLTKTKEEKGN